MVPWWVEQRAEQLILELREILVRHDENLKAHTLLQDCVPFFLEENHPQIPLQRDAQAAMVAHITGGPDAYADYYATNTHERPFEDQYGVQPADAHKHIPRATILRDSLQQLQDTQAAGRGELPTLLDCACNDGWLGVNLRGLVDYHGIDLNPDCVQRAKGRHVRRGRFLQGDVHQAAVLTEEIRPAGGYDYVVCFECIEHVPDPHATIRALAQVVKPGGRMFISTPSGATESGDLAQWWKIEPKGHVRVFTPATFMGLLEPYGTVEGIVLGPDQVMVARVLAPG